MPDHLDQSRIFLRTVRDRLMQPLVKPGPRYFQDTTHQHERKFVPVLIHEPVLYSGSLAKYRAAFLRNSLVSN